MAEEQAREVGVHTLVAADELVGEGEAGHEAALLHPEDGREATREEDTLDGGERDETFTEGGLVVRDPFECPIGLLLDTGNGINSVKEVFTLCRVLNVGINEE